MQAEVLKMASKTYLEYHQMNTLTAWSLDRVKRYLAKQGDYTPEEIDKLEIEYKRYLFLRSIYPNLDLPMSVPVDPMWHAHILFTELYWDMCQLVLGRFLHHKPMEDESEAVRLRSAYRDNTIAMYTKHFGDPDPAYWPTNGAVCLCNGGDCE